MAKKKEMYLNIDLGKYNEFKHRVGIHDKPDDNLGQINLHDGIVSLDFETEEKLIQIDVDKNVFDLVIETYLYGDFIRSSNDLMKGQLIRRQKQLIEKLQKRNDKLIEKKKEMGV